MDKEKRRQLLLGLSATAEVADLRPDERELYGLLSPAIVAAQLSNGDLMALETHLIALSDHQPNSFVGNRSIEPLERFLGRKLLDQIGGSEKVSEYTKLLISFDNLAQ